MHILFVSYRFPPVVTSESLLIPRLLWALDQFGCKITVLTAKEETCTGSIDTDLLRLIPSNVEIVRVSGHERTLSSFRSLPYRLLKKIGLTDRSDLWYFQAARVGKKLLQERSFNIIYSRASTFISNVVGLRLKHFSNLPWVAHFSDPWVGNPYLYPNYNILQKKIADFLEKSIIHKADGIVFTTQQTANMVISRYPEILSNKVHAIPHGYDPRESISLSKQSASHSRLRLVHAGNFFGQRNPLSLFEALKKLKKNMPLHNKLEVVLIGQIDEKYRNVAEKLNLNNIIDFKGRLPFNLTLQELAKADVLLLIEATSTIPPIFLPSKLIDYLPFEKAILGITPHQSPSADLLRRLKCPIVEPTDISGIANIIFALIKQFEDGRLYEVKEKELQNILSGYDIRQVTRTLMDIFEKAISSNNYLTIK